MDGAHSRESSLPAEVLRGPRLKVTPPHGGRPSSPTSSSSRASAFSNLSPQLQAEYRARRRWLKIAACLGVLLILGIVFAPNLYRVGKSWRVRQLTQQAEELIKLEKWEEASAKAQAAYQLKIDEPAAVRTAAHLKSATGHPGEALPFWRQLAEMKGLTTEDRRRQADDLFHAGALSEAEQQNTELQTFEPGNAADLRLAARIALSEGYRQRGLEFAQKAQAAEPGNEEGKLLLSAVQWEAREPDLRAKGQQGLLEIARGTGRTSLGALVGLAGRRDLPPEVVQEIVPLLRAHPLAGESQKLVALDLEISAHPEQRAAILEREEAVYKAADPGRLRAFAVWLNTHGEWERTLRMVPEERAAQRKDLLLVRLDALAALKRWTDIQSILDDEKAPLDQVYKEVFLARSAMELGQVTAASLHWTRAHTEAASSAEQMWFVGRYAETLGQTDEAERAYSSLKASSLTARPAYEALLHLTEKKRETVAQRELLSEMHARWPQDAAVSNDYAFLSLLLGKEVEGCLLTARQLVAQAPSSLPHRTTLALALLRTGDAKGALDVYKGIQITWDRVAPGARAVHVAVLGANGLGDEARQEVRSLRLEDLRAEERELVQPWL